MQECVVRKAGLVDAEIIASFNQQMALETENKQIDSQLALAGVQGLLTKPDYGFYLLAELQGQVVASLMITTEWSDWRNAVFWWIQSVYVRPEFRQQGIYRQLYTGVKRLATEQTEAICGFRLYADKANHKAQITYERLGMRLSNYLVYEEMQSGFTH